MKGNVMRNCLLEAQEANDQSNGEAAPGAADPWGSIHVRWDLKDGGHTTQVCVLVCL